MAELMRGWSIGTGRPCKHKSLPLPNHRNMAEVLAQESRHAVERGAIALQPKETKHAPRPSNL